MTDKAPQRKLWRERRLRLREIVSTKSGVLGNIENDTESRETLGPGDYSTKHGDPVTNKLPKKQGVVNLIFQN